MKNMRIGTIAALIVATFSVTAFAAVVEFPHFTVDVPSDWTASEKGPTAILVANDHSASISITVDKTNGMSYQALAAAFSKELKGSEPQSRGHHRFHSGEIDPNHRNRSSARELLHLALIDMINN